jgi:hypothetical protein
VNDDVDRLRAARYLLYQDAEFCREGRENFAPLSGLEWEARAAASEAGQLLGSREIDAISSMVFGRRKLRPTRGVPIR